jgi:hypothetical protein
MKCRCDLVCTEACKRGVRVQRVCVCSDVDGAKHLHAPLPVDAANISLMARLMCCRIATLWPTHHSGNEWSSDQACPRKLVSRAVPHGRARCDILRSCAQLRTTRFRLAVGDGHGFAWCVAGVHNRSLTKPVLWVSCEGLFAVTLLSLLVRPGWCRRNHQPLQP